MTHNSQKIQGKFHSLQEEELANLRLIVDSDNLWDSS
jgi:hypothetical protein